MADRVVAFGPGRVNLIGEHTDYNGGFAMPFAIERGVTVTATPAKRFVVDALDLDERDEFKKPEKAPGLARVRARDGGRVAHRRVQGRPRAPGDLRRPAAGQRALVLGGTGSGAGARSGRRRRRPGELAKLCSRVENDWVGAETGLLDQFASLLSQPGHVLRIDFRTLEVEPHPLDLGDWQLVTVDSGATHSHAGSGYNERRAECRAACEALGIDSLRDATTSRASTARCSSAYVTSSARTSASTRPRRPSTPTTCRGRRAAGPSHASLRDDYEASVPEVEATVERLKSAGAAGARMVGGGFGGSVLALLPPASPGRPAPSSSPPALPLACSDSASSSPSGRVNAHSRISSPNDEHRRGPRTG